MSGEGARASGPADVPGSPSASAVRVMLVDDHRLVLEGLRLVLEQRPGIRVVGEAEGRGQAFALLGGQAVDVVLLDVTYPDDDGLVLLRELVARWPAVKVIVLTMHRDAETVRQALRAGAHGYVVKGARTSELVEAIGAVMRGDRYLHSAVAGTVIDDSIRWMAVESPLTAREREILVRLASGATAADVGRELGISRYTVRRHVANLSAKLGVRGPKALTRYALEHGLLRDRRQGEPPGSSRS